MSSDGGNPAGSSPDRTDGGLHTPHQAGSRRPGNGEPADSTYRRDIPLAPYTTLRLGGPARLFRTVRSEREVVEALRYARSERLPVHILGGGSNVVFPDEGFRGLVVHVAIPGMELRPRADAVEATAAAGVAWDALVRAAVERGLTGIECLSGIPGSVGAAPIQNIGAYGQELADTLIHVDAIDRETLRTTRFGADECGFAYRWSRFKGPDRDRFVILGISLRLAAGVPPLTRYPELEAVLRARTEAASSDAATSEAEPAEPEPAEPARAVRLVREAVLELRSRKAMLVREGDPDSRSAGSFFLNPVLSGAELDRLRMRAAERGIDATGVPTFPARDGNGVKVPAAWLVERAGFPKGFRRGGVGISERHALALVNRGGTARELLQLSDEIRRAVYAQFGVRLEPEPVIVSATT